MANWTELLGFDPRTGSGWIPPAERTVNQTALHERVMGATPAFGDIVSVGDLPDAALFVYLELKHRKQLLWRFLQFSGSCVAVGGARAYLHAAIGDIEFRGDREAIEPCFPFATWGIGRQRGGLRGRGDGSFGAAQAEAVHDWGMLRASDPRLPRYKTNGNWISWSKQIEYEWSWPPQFPVRIPDGDASQYSVGDIVRIRTTDEAAGLFASGHGCTIACMFGTQGPRLRDGVMLADWDDEWAHQQCVAGYVTHRTHGRIWLVDNQWGFDAHPECPYLAGLIRQWCEQFGIATVPRYGGSYWVTDKTFARMIQDECFGHAGTKGFDPRPRLDWGGIGIV